MTDDHDRLVSIDYFMGMLGVSSRNYYYDHVNDPGFPQRIPLADSRNVKLSLADCVAYIERLKTKPAGPPPKRKPGRPRKPSVRPAA